MERSMSNNSVNCGKPKGYTGDPKVIRSQALHVRFLCPRGREGSETRDRAKAVISPRAQSIFSRDDEIVRSWLKSQRQSKHLPIF